MMIIERIYSDHEGLVFFIISVLFCGIYLFENMK